MKYNLFILIIPNIALELIALYIIDFCNISGFSDLTILVLIFIEINLIVDKSLYLNHQ